MRPWCKAIVFFLSMIVRATDGVPTSCPATDDEAFFLQISGKLGRLESFGEARTSLAETDSTSARMLYAGVLEASSVVVAVELALFISLFVALACVSVRCIAGSADGRSCGSQQSPLEDHEGIDEVDMNGADVDGSGATPCVASDVAGETTKPRVLQAAALLFIVLMSMDNAIIIPGSYDLVSMLNVSAGLSGALYGVFSLGQVVGVLYARRAAHNWHQESIRLQIIAALFAVGCLDLVYAFVLRFLDMQGEKLFWILVLVRFCTGVCIGVVFLLHWMALHVTKQADQTSFALLYAVAINSGMICAPLVLVAAVTVSARIDPTEGSLHGQFAAPACPLALLWLALALLVSFVMPRRLDSEVSHDKPAHSEQSSEAPVAALPVESRRSLVRLGLVVALERSFIVAGIELGTTMLLEMQFGWPLRSVGIGLMIVGLCTIAVCCIGAAAKSAGHGPGARMLVTASVVGVLAMLPFFDIKQSGPPAILTADALVYASTFLTQGICDGLSVNAAMKGGAGYTLEDYQLGKVVCLCFGRAGGATCARSVLDSFGRNAYAISQLAIGFLGCVTACKVASLV